MRHLRNENFSSPPGSLLPCCLDPPKLYAHPFLQCLIWTDREQKSLTNNGKGEESMDKKVVGVNIYSCLQNTGLDTACHVWKVIPLYCQLEQILDPKMHFSPLNLCSNLEFKWCHLSASKKGRYMLSLVSYWVFLPPLTLSMSLQTSPFPLQFCLLEMSSAH